jgi:hypothetical protein
MTRERTQGLHGEKPVTNRLSHDMANISFLEEERKVHEITMLCVSISISLDKFKYFHEICYERYASGV